MNISIPDPLKSCVEERVAGGEFGTPAEYVRDLIRQDREKRLERLEASLLQAMESKSFEVTPEELSQRSLVAILREKLAR